MPTSCPAPSNSPHADSPDLSPHDTLQGPLCQLFVLIGEKTQDRQSEVDLLLGHEDFLASTPCLKPTLLTRSTQLPNQLSATHGECTLVSYPGHELCVLLHQGPGAFQRDGN